ncbi:hypothetical protein JNUCC1_03138 [Lentibacillus sp. JNUCC-1]|uniref:hypothetical protein n=1 Tax=Lentibacillus sp. JNUCC-1 TaxID=2654513 RepID=UPI0012E6FFFD|nr:hypothetical protein [Lentibacillus sp. JNUCC-1]MUV39265.1 hypothetical protein [Lentibacillus sp. JNUCC-1]
MNRITQIVFLSCLLILPVSLVGATSPSESVDLHTFYEDVSGDGLKEQISLKGYPLKGDSQFVHDIALYVTNEQTEQYVHIGSGYYPEVTAIQIAEDSAPVIFIQMQSSTENDALKRSSLYTIKNKKIKPLDLPELDYLKTDLKAPFTLTFQTAPYERQISADLSDHKYKETIFTSSGKIKDDHELWIHDNTEYNVLSLGNKPDVMLEGETPIKASNKQGPLIGYVKTLWKYTEENEWLNVYKTWVTPNEK